MRRQRQARQNGRESFLRSDSGATVIEFALLAPIFFTLVFTTLEFAMVLFQRGSIEDITHQVARMGITGDTYGGTGNRQEILMELLEERLGGIVFDPNAFTITSEVYASYDNANNGNAGNNVNNTFGGSDQVVRYTITYEHSYLTPAGVLAHIGDGLTLRSTVFVKNEAY